MQDLVHLANAPYPPGPGLLTGPHLEAVLVHVQLPVELLRRDEALVWLHAAEQGPVGFER